MRDNLLGQTVKDTSGRIYHLVKSVGEGAQGVVYETSDEFIVKHCFTTKECREELTERFLWIMNQRVPKDARVVTPIAVLDHPHTGYVMKKVKGHEPLTKYVTASTKIPFAEWYNHLTGGLKKRLEIGASLSKCFRNLHLHGLSYVDISPSNVLVARKVKSVVFIDPDNLTSTGTFKTNILGTPRYIAPELFTGGHQPNSITDTYAFAVILFELLRLGHPLLGEDLLEEEPEREEEALRGEAVYIDHPTDDSNRNTKLLPAKYVFTEELAQLFERMFVDGLHDYTKRPTMQEFRLACQRAEDLLVDCNNPDCGSSYFLEGKEAVCPWCQTRGPQPFRFVSNETITLKAEVFPGEKMDVPTKNVSDVLLKEGYNLLCRRHFEPASSLDGDEKVAVLELTSSHEIYLHTLPAHTIVLFNKSSRKNASLPPEKRIRIASDDVMIYKFTDQLHEVEDIYGKCVICNYGVVLSQEDSIGS